MTITELIDILKEIKDCCGNLDVEVWSNPYDKGKYVALDEEMFESDSENNTLRIG